MKTWTVSLNMEISGIEAETEDEAKEEFLKLIKEDENYQASAIDYMEVQSEE